MKKDYFLLGPAEEINDIQRTLNNFIFECSRDPSDYSLWNTKEAAEQNKVDWSTYEKPLKWVKLTVEIEE
jgi:hypothetical protein